MKLVHTKKGYGNTNLEKQKGNILQLCEEWVPRMSKVFGDYRPSKLQQLHCINKYICQKQNSKILHKAQAKTRDRNDYQNIKLEKGVVGDRHINDLKMTVQTLRTSIHLGYNSKLTLLIFYKP